jgi:cytochrome P450
MSACVMVGPELGDLDSEWQSLSMDYVKAALSAPGKIKNKYPTWLYWLSRYANDGVKAMWKSRYRARELLHPVLEARKAATAEYQTKGGDRKAIGRRKYEDGVQWLLDAHTAKGKQLTPDQLAQDLFVIMTASIHSTSGTALAILFDMIEHSDALSEIMDEIKRVQNSNPTWTRQALGELRILDSFMRESARVHALTQCKYTNTIVTSVYTMSPFNIWSVLVI